MESKGPRIGRVFGAKVRIFRLFGIDVNIHFSWVFIFVLGSWIMSSQFAYALAYNYPSLFANTGLAGWVLGALAVIFLFVSVLIHEFSHSLIAKAFGIRVDGITLFFMGGVSMLNVEDMRNKATPRKEFLISAAGPFMSIVLGLFFTGIYSQIEGTRVGQFSTPLFLISWYLILVNFLLAIFNSLPAFPLDGGRMLLSLLQIARIGKEWAYRVTVALGSAISFAMMALGFMIILGVLPLSPVQGVWLIMIGFFIYTMGRAEYEQFKKEVLEEKGRGTKDDRSF